MRTLLVMLMCSCLLASSANAQGIVQLGERLRKFSQPIINPGNRENHIRVQKDLLPREDIREEAPAINRREATDLARGAYPGRVLGVRLEGDHWRVRMDDNGTVFNVLVDVESGAVVRPE